MILSLSRSPSVSAERANRHVVIIGAGPGGLASAMLLASAGLRVTLLERRDRVGGRTSLLGGDGFRFDMGPTFFLYPRVLDKVFLASGRRLRNEVDLVRLDPQYRLVFGAGGKIDASPDVSRMQAELRRFSEADAVAFRRFLDDNRVKLDAFRAVLERPFLSWLDLLSWDVLKTLPLVKPWRSVYSELSRYFSDERVRLAFTFQSKYLGMSPFNCPSLFSILSFLEYEHGVWHPVGGCGAVSEAMAAAAREMGVDVRLDADVTAMSFEGRRCTGVTVGGDHIPADAVVVNADFARAMTRLVPDALRRRWTDRKLAGKRYSCSTFMMYLGVEGKFDDAAHHTIWLAEDYTRNLEQIETTHELPDNPSFYVQNPCVTDPSMAPEGMSSLYVLAPVSHQHPNIDWGKEKAAFRQRVLKQMGKIGMGDVERRIRWEKVITPADWEAGMEIHRGATFNLAHNLTQMLHFRPRNRFEDLDGVYLVGGGTHPGSGLPVIYESAYISSRLLLEDFGLPTAFLDRASEESFRPAALPPSHSAPTLPASAFPGRRPGPAVPGHVAARMG
jgi:phytoene desaturase